MLFRIEWFTPSNKGLRANLYPSGLAVLECCSVVRRLSHSEDFPLLRSVLLPFEITARREPFYSKATWRRYTCQLK